MILLFFAVISQAREASIALPEKAKEGDDVTLYCKHDRSGARLHQVRWLLNGEEFVSLFPITAVVRAAEQIAF